MARWRKCVSSNFHRIVLLASNNLTTRSHDSRPNYLDYFGSTTNSISTWLDPVTHHHKRPSEEDHSQVIVHHQKRSSRPRHLKEPHRSSSSTVSEQTRSRAIIPATLSMCLPRNCTLHLPPHFTAKELNSQTIASVPRKAVMSNFIRPAHIGGIPWAGPALASRAVVATSWEIAGWPGAHSNSLGTKLSHSFT